MKIGSFQEKRSEKRNEKCENCNEKRNENHTEVRENQWRIQDFP